MKPKHSAFFIVLALFAVLVSLYLTSCVTIEATYRGVTGSYDGKTTRLTVDGNKLANSLRGYAK